VGERREPERRGTAMESPRNREGERAGVVPPDGLWQSWGILRETRLPCIE